jgi:hypothetical protein
VTGVASPLLQSVEGIRVGDGSAHRTVDRSEPRATGRQMVGGAAAMAWHARGAWPPQLGLGSVWRGAGCTVLRLGPFDPCYSFQVFSNIEGHSNL